MDLIQDAAEWAWARHHNPWSWYVRPMLILPFCYFAWRRSLAGVIGTVLLALTSIAWFPEPATPDPEIARYLAAERRWLHSPPLVLLIAVLAVGFLWLFAAAFWTRRWLYGLVVLNLGTLAKVVFSIAMDGEAGWATLPPAAATLAVCNGAVTGLWLWVRHRKGREATRP